MIKNIKLSYIFNFFAILLLVGVYILNISFENTKHIVSQKSLHSEINYTIDLSNNIIEHIKDEVGKENIYDVLEKDEYLKKHLESFLQTFNTNRYKYIYVVQKAGNEFRFLLDASKNVEDKAEFGELYTPLEISKWNDVYKTKKISYFSHKDDETLWITFINPIVKNGQVEALLILDFSIKEYAFIVEALNKLNGNFNYTLMFSMAVFMVIVIFSYVDYKREREREKIKIELQSKNKQLQYAKKYLQNRVKEEVLKSREKDAQMVEQSRLAQMGEMISMIAHQWRQPLAAIGSVGNSLIIKSQLGTLNSDVVEDLASKVVAYSKHLSSTIDDFRNFFKENKEKTKTNYDEIVNSSLSIVEAALSSKDIKIIKELESKKEFVSYANELKQVVLNLVKNAEDVLIENSVKEPYIKIKTYDTENKHILEVSDNGGGIPDEIIDKIFNPYFSTKKKKDGTGLGLYMSKTIVDEHCDGSLSVSNSSVGAVFKIVLHD